MKVKIWHDASEAPTVKGNDGMIWIIAVMEDAIHVEQLVFDICDQPWEEILEDTKVWKWAYRKDLLAELYSDNEAEK